MTWWLWILVVATAVVLGVIIHDITQKRHAILRNFPLVGHLRYLLESAGPELRQYVVADNDEELPFSRDQRRWIYASAKSQNPYFGFGTDNDLSADGYIFLRHAAFPVVDDSPDDLIPSTKILGGLHEREHAFRPRSIINTSAMSFGSLSGPAVEAINRGVALAGCMQNTGEGGISVHHRHGGDLIFQIGTGYFGARDASGEFSIERVIESAGLAPVKAIEIKLSQGAKPGLGGVLPAAKVTKEIATARGVPVGVTVHSPSRHAEFDDIAGLVDFVELIAAETGLPVGIKSAIGEEAFWHELSSYMAASGRGPDFVTVDGGEGGTGAAPGTFSDHVALPFRNAFPVVLSAFAEHGLHEQITFFGSGRLGFATDATVAMAMGVDMINVGREAMMSIGCIQAQRCHTGHCPTGVATQNRWLTRGLDPTEKSVRLASYIAAFHHELRTLSHAMGAEHPALIDPAQIDFRASTGRLESAISALGIDPAIVDETHRHNLRRLLTEND